MAIKSITIRQLKISPPLLLAPMAGLTHSALRSVLSLFGGIGLFSTEMLSARRLPSENQTISPYLIKTESERPLSYQLFITSPEEVKNAVTSLHKFGADAIDLNLGCPAPHIRNAGGGSSLMAKRQTVQDIVRLTRKCTDLPLTAKIRLGEKLDKQALLDFCVMLEGEGVDMLTVHGRLRGEKFCRPARWEWISYAKEKVTVPVVANGSIFSVEDARRCLQVSGADGLMIGRAAPQKPWIFADIAREVYGADLPCQNMPLPEIFMRFAGELASRFRVERRLGRLKEFTSYFAGNYPFGHSLASKVQSSVSLEEAVKGAWAFFERNDRKGVEAFMSSADGNELFNELLG